MDLLRRALQYEVSVGALIEVALWLAIMPAGSDVAAFGLTVALWPASPQIAAACPAK